MVDEQKKVSSYIDSNLLEKWAMSKKKVSSYFDSKFLEKYAKSKK